MKSEEVARGRGRRVEGGREEGGEGTKVQKLLSRNHSRIADSEIFKFASAVNKMASGRYTV
jgi:hypothetical protein